MKNRILCYKSCWNEMLPPADDARKWEDVIIKDVLITARDPSVILPLCAADYSSPSQLSLKCPSQITDSTSIHHTPAQHAPHIHLAADRDTFKFNGRETEQKQREKHLIYQNTRKQNCLCAWQKKTKARSCQTGYGKREGPRAMREDVIDMMLLIKEWSRTAEEEKRGLEMLYTLHSIRLFSLGLEQDINNPTLTAATVIV